MPFSHQIFWYQRLYPNYDRQLHAIGKYIESKLGALFMCDVGANIGDTACFMNIQNASYLLIEGEKSYSNLINQNIKHNFGIEISGEQSSKKPHFALECAFISDEMDDKYEVELKDGSGRLLKTSTQGQTTLKTLDNIIKTHNFNVNFLKIDTDGFDFKVLRSARETLERFKPAIFFEWDKVHLSAQGENPLNIFKFIYDLGYLELLIFDNFGNLLCKTQSNDITNLSLLIDYTLRDERIFYYDVLSFQQNSKLSASEFLAFFKH